MLTPFNKNDRGSLITRSNLQLRTKVNLSVLESHQLDDPSTWCLFAKSNLLKRNLLTVHELTHTHTSVRLQGKDKSVTSNFLRILEVHEVHRADMLIKPKVR